jgi:hypothetical protein
MDLDRYLTSPLSAQSAAKAGDKEKVMAYCRCHGNDWPCGFLDFFSLLFERVGAQIDQ